MDSGWAVVLGASIALIGSAIVPWVREAITRRSERKERLSEARLTALRRIIPELLGAGVPMTSKPDMVNMEKTLKLLGEFDVWLTAEEWPLSRMAMMALVTSKGEEENKMRRYVAVQSILPAWMRGEMSPTEAKAAFEKMTGAKVERFLATATGITTHAPNRPARK